MRLENKPPNRESGATLKPTWTYPVILTYLLRNVNSMVCSISMKVHVEVSMHGFRFLLNIILTVFQTFIVTFNIKVLVSLSFFFLFIQHNIEKFMFTSQDRVCFKHKSHTSYIKNHVFFLLSQQCPGFPRRVKMLIYVMYQRAVLAANRCCFKI